MAVDSIVENSAVPAAIEDCRIPGCREELPEARKPMPFGGLAAVVMGAVDHVMTRVERRRELAKRAPLAGAVGPLEQDDRAPAMHDLRQLQLRQMIAQRRERRLIIFGDVVG